MMGSPFAPTLNFHPLCSVVTLLPMTQSQPRQYDAVLGGQVPAGAVVLGGFDGIRKRLTSAQLDHRLAALPEALNYDQRGLNLVIRALGDRALEVREAAYRLLKDRPEPQVRRAVERFYAESNYQYLRSLLATKQWQAADQETRISLFKLCGLYPTSQFQPGRITGCFCQDLRAIDQLWQEFSHGHFGFSVQQALWHDYYSRYWEKAEIWARFADRVGWRVNNLLVENYWKRYDELTFTLNAPAGHLPHMGDAFGIFTLEVIVNRLNDCKGVES